MSRIFEPGLFDLIIKNFHSHQSLFMIVIHLRLGNEGIEQKAGVSEERRGGQDELRER